MWVNVNSLAPSLDSIAVIRFRCVVNFGAKSALLPANYTCASMKIELCFGVRVHIWECVRACDEYVCENTCWLQFDTFAVKTKSTIESERVCVCVCIFSQVSDHRCYCTTSMRRLRWLGCDVGRVLQMLLSSLICETFGRQHISPYLLLIFDKRCNGAEARNPCPCFYEQGWIFEEIFPWKRNHVSEVARLLLWRNNHSAAISCFQISHILVIGQVIVKPHSSVSPLFENDFPCVVRYPIRWHCFAFIAADVTFRCTVITHECYTIHARTYARTHYIENVRCS